MGQCLFDSRLNLIALDVRVDGIGERSVALRMVVDTGASFTIISWSAAEALGYHPERSPRRIQFMMGSGREAAPMFTVKAIEAVGVTLGHIPVLCHDLPQGSLVDGLLGISFLRHGRLAIDFQRGILQLERRAR